VVIRHVVLSLRPHLLPTVPPTAPYRSPQARPSPTGTLELLRRLRHARPGAARVHALDFGRGAGRPAGFLADAAAAGAGQYFHYAEPCGLPARVARGAGAQQVHAARCAAVARENAVVHAEAHARHFEETRAAKGRNEAAVEAAAQRREAQRREVAVINAGREAGARAAHARAVEAARDAHKAATRGKEHAWRRSVRAVTAANAEERERHRRALQVCAAPARLPPRAAPATARAPLATSACGSSGGGGRGGGGRGGSRAQGYGRGTRMGNGREEGRPPYRPTGPRAPLPAHRRAVFTRARARAAGLGGCARRGSDARERAARGASRADRGRRQGGRGGTCAAVLRRAQAPAAPHRRA
jgi:hypothetical protein